MEESRKTKIQLLDEIERLRRRVAELEAASPSASSPKGVAISGSSSRSPRIQMEAVIEFIGDFDVVQARGVNLSEGGICFEVVGPLPFEMKFDMQGREMRQRAHLLWMKRLSDEKFRYGFRFVPLELHPEI